MPQINQLSEIFISQLFWLGVVFGIVYFVIGRWMVPKIRTTVDAREKRIAEDLERAQAARAEADETEAQWRQRMDAARVEAARIAQSAKQTGALETEAKIKSAQDGINLKLEAAESRIRDAVVAARTEIEDVAAEAAQEMIARLTGLQINRNEAASAVKAELHV